ncbi:hypothetical protein F2Q68_00023980 [Brassica cretica]|uniref:Uncharacterized protein n=1 Tax=Brassica cretica TaxID=69181 RepID=A0A8S9I9F3_BRACR|nr:hypothetical protein F2Q68_00023980 [Brassica cretica]
MPHRVISRPFIFNEIGKPPSPSRGARRKVKAGCPTSRDQARTPEAKAGRPPKRKRASPESDPVGTLNPEGKKSGALSF